MGLQTRVFVQCLQDDATGGQIGHHDFTKAIVRVDRFVKEQRERGRMWEDTRREIPYHHVGGSRREIDQAAFRDKKRWECGINILEIWGFRLTFGTRMEIAEVDWVNIEGGRVERSIVSGKQ